MFTYSPDARGIDINATAARKSTLKISILKPNQRTITRYKYQLYIVWYDTKLMGKKSVDNNNNNKNSRQNFLKLRDWTCLNTVTEAPPEGF